MRHEATVRRLAGELAGQEGFELVDVLLSPGERRLTIRIFIHRLGGVTIEDCQRFSESLSALLEVEGAVQGPYVLEVSSPGLTRPLKNAADYRRNLGQPVRLAYLASDGSTADAEGRIVGVEDDTLLLETAAGSLRVPIGAVRNALPSIDWRELFRAGKKRSASED